MKSKVYKYPLLCVILSVLGCLNLIIAGVSLIGMVAISGSAGAGEAFVTGIGTLLGGLLLLGISQLIDHISRMAFDVRLIREAVEEYGAKSSVTAMASLPVKTKQPAQNIIRHTARKPRFFYSINGDVSGPVERAELERLWSAGKINVETFVCADGENDWQRLEDMMAAT